jgi:hypothetical protein
MALWHHRQPAAYGTIGSRRASNLKTIAGSAASTQPADYASAVGAGAVTMRIEAFLVGRRCKARADKELGEPLLVDPALFTCEPQSGASVPRKERSGRTVLAYVEFRIVPILDAGQESCRR